MFQEVGQWLEDSELSLFIWSPICCLVYLIRTDLSNELGRLFSSSTLWGLRSRDEEVNFNLVVYLFLSLPHRPPTLREPLASGFVFQTTVALISLIQRLFLNESLMGRSNGFPGGWWSRRPEAPSSGPSSCRDPPRGHGQLTGLSIRRIGSPPLIHSPCLLIHLNVSS